MSNEVPVRALIFVFALPGCGACHDYLPRLEKQVKTFQQHGIPLVISTGRPPTKGQIPIIIADASSPDPSIQGLLDQYGIDAMPTTVLVTCNAQAQILVGALDETQIYEVLSSAALASR